MAESASLKKSSIIKEWMVQADPPKEANGEKNGWPVPTPFFKYSDTLLQIQPKASGALKKYMLSLQKFEASNRSS